MLAQLRCLPDSIDADHVAEAAGAARLDARQGVLEDCRLPRCQAEGAGTGARVSPGTGPT